MLLWNVFGCTPPSPNPPSPTFLRHTHKNTHCPLSVKTGELPACLRKPNTYTHPGNQYFSLSLYSSIFHPSLFPLPLFLLLPPSPFSPHLCHQDFIYLLWTNRIPTSPLSLSISSIACSVHYVVVLGLLIFPIIRSKDSSGPTDLEIDKQCRRTNRMQQKESEPKEQRLSREREMGNIMSESLAIPSNCIST